MSSSNILPCFFLTFYQAELSYPWTIEQACSGDLKNNRSTSTTGGSPVFGGAIVGNSGVYTVRKRRSSDPPLYRPRFQHTLYFSYSDHSGHVAPASSWRVVRPQGSHHKAQGWATACFPVLTTLGSRAATWGTLTECVRPVHLGDFSLISKRSMWQVQLLPERNGRLQPPQSYVDKTEDPCCTWFTKSEYVACTCMCVHKVWSVHVLAQWLTAEDVQIQVWHAACISS